MTSCIKRAGERESRRKREQGKVRAGERERMEWWNLSLLPFSPCLSPCLSLSLPLSLPASLPPCLSLSLPASLVLHSKLGAWGESAGQKGARGDQRGLVWGREGGLGWGLEIRLLGEGGGGRGGGRERGEAAGVTPGTSSDTKDAWLVSRLAN